MAQTRARGSAKSQERFSTVSPTRVPRSAFDRSHSHKTTIDSGLLYPIFIDEVLPGDTLKITPAFFARMATPLTPFMDGIHLDYQFFYTPLRLVWDNFVRMMGERPAPDDHNDYTVPQMVAPGGGYLVRTLSDYLTLPTEQGGFTHSSLFHRNYNLVYREWYRDENLQDPPIVDMDDGPDDPLDYVLLRRGKRKDYFTGSLPFAQKGDPVQLPLGTSAPVSGTISAAGQPSFDVAAGGTNDLEQQLDNGVTHFESGSNTGAVLWVDPALDFTGGLADLSAAIGSTINEMRSAIGIQHLLERDARGGTRYREQVLAHFGVQTDDIRLMRPELLSTGSTPVNVSPVASTVQFPGQPLGTLAAFATAQAVGRGFMKTFTEHGIVMGLCSVRAELTYQRGLHRMFSRLTRFDHYWPDLATLGEQAVISREIYVDGTGDPDLETGDFEIWGYQPRYEEYRHRESIITGEFRSDFGLSLDIWHLAQDFQTRPVLNAAFIEENPPIDRILALEDEPEFLLDSFFKIQHVRAMPKFGVPGMTRF